MMKQSKATTLFVLAGCVALAGCSDRKRAEQASGSATPGTAPAEGGVIRVDGSSTVFPISQAVAEEFQKKSGARVTVGLSGTGGGFKKFCRGDIDVTGASRPIKPTEVEACKSAGIEFVELPVAFDGLAVVVHKDNSWVDHLSVAELKTMWEPEAQGKVTNWNQVRDGFPDKELQLLGPGVDSGTYDYFTKAINGKEHASRGDFIASEDDNVLVQGVANDLGAIAFFGFAYYVENKDKLKLVPLDDGDASDGDGPVAPSLESVLEGTYQPLSRPIFIYVRTKAAETASVAAFVDFYLAHGAALSSEVGYIPLPAKVYELAKARFTARTAGSSFGEGSQIGVSIESVLSGGK